MGSSDKKGYGMDIVRKFFSFLLPLGGLGVMGWYMYHGVGIVKEYASMYQYFVLGALALLFVFFLFQFGFSTLSVKRLKAKGIVVGLLVILMGRYFLISDADARVYAGDIIMLIGVCMVYFTIAGLIVSKKAVQKATEARQVVIEV